MIARLARLEIAIQPLLLLSIAIILGTRLLVHDPGDALPLSMMQLMTLVPTVCAIAIAMQRTNTGFLAGLPVPVRSIYLARTGILLAAMVLPIVAVVVLDGVVGSTSPLLEYWRMLGWSLLALLPLLAYQASGLRNPRGMVWLLAPLAGVEGLLVYLAVFFDRNGLDRHWMGGWQMAPVAILVVGTVIVGTWWTAPKSLTANPRIRQGSASSTRRRLPAWRFLPMLRSLYSWQTLMWWPILFMQGITQPGHVPSLMTGFAVLAGWRGVNWLQPLPVSRRAILAGLVVPAVAAALAGHFAYTPTHVHGYRMPVQLTQGSCGLPTFALPFNWWERVNTEEIPEIRAPWGETQQPDVDRLGGIRIYNPYSVGCGNSEKFAWWQIERAYLASQGQSAFRRAILDGAVFSAMALMSTMLVLLAAWWRFITRSAWVRWTSVIAASIIFLALALVEMLPQPWRVLQNTVAWLGFVLPGYSVALLVLPLGLVYWTLERLALRGEFSSKISPEAQWQARWGGGA